ncbi:guanine nucleotide binding protein, alpha subunit [Gymnopus androsaceus JB14]|uniref:Guanine nucleotide binding protein, alpha subunit n=1 Tax=Gymnopus androsaceus JB14 TaxID=1447944 RepID=A0A6A4IFF0_9AGAR|nr:guanine nucleotide binding protein, alpha subunit [Gymnopus androsaceus JB14]
MPNDSDPFAEFVRPPLNETSSERAARKIRESEERRVSDAIDEQIRQERQLLQKQKDLTKILLLGQSESGKSTTLKNFRLAYAREEWEAEKVSWRAVIQLNLIRSILSILETVRAEIDGEPLLELDDTKSADIPLDGNDLDPSIQTQLSSDELQRLQTLRLRLSPLRRVEIDLKLKLGAGTEEVTSMDQFPDSWQPDPERVQITQKSRPKRIQGDEMVVRGLRWREFLSHGRTTSFIGRTRASIDVQDSVDRTAAEILAGCRDDMKMLWMNPAVQTILRKRRIEMENSAGFFLNDIDRIASISYLPSDDDVVRSRLRTVGVQEYHIFVPPENSRTSLKEWALYDVGGSRTMRRAWIPFFEGKLPLQRLTFGLILACLQISLLSYFVSNIAIVIERRLLNGFPGSPFAIVAPVSCFDEALLEDSSVNRLSDSIGLWKAIVSSKLLQNTTLICFLNKCDILKRKLKNGVQFHHSVREYGSKPNDLTSVIKFLKESMKNIVHKYTVNQKRMTYIYTTSVTDTKATATTLGSVRDSIIRANLASAHLVV